MNYQYRDELEQIGEAMFGKRWKWALADLLCLSRTNISRYMCGDVDVPDKVICHARAVFLLYRYRILPLLDVPRTPFKMKTKPQAPAKMPQARKKAMRQARKVAKAPRTGRP